MPHLFTAMGDGSWRVRKEAVAVLAKAEPKGEEVVEGLISLLRASDNAGLRNSAVESLERLGPVAVRPLCRYLDDPDHDLRKFVIDILGSIRCASCVPLLVKALHDSDPNVRLAAAENLGKIGDAGALPHLLKVLEGEEGWLKFTVLDALALIGAPVPLSAFTPLLQEKLLRRAIYDCLGVLGDAGAVPVLLQGLQDKGKTPRVSAAVAVMKVRERLSADDAAALIDRPLKELQGTAAAEGAIAALQGADPSQVEALARLVAIIGDERATLPLLSISVEERNRPACLAALRCIGAAAVPLLLAHFDQAQYAERAVVAHLLGELGATEATALLLAGLHDDAPEVRASSAAAVAKLADAIGVRGGSGEQDQSRGGWREVAPLLDDADARVRKAALESLQRFSSVDAAGIASLAAELARSEHPEKRLHAALLLGGLSDGERLSRLAKDEDATVRRAAVASLGNVRLPQTVGHLAMALSDEDAEVRFASAQALSEIGGEEVLEPLLVALNDADAWVRSASLKGLSSLGDRRALPAVKALLSEAKGPVLIAVLSALAAIGGAEEAGAIEGALADGDEEVVEAAIGIMSALGQEWVEKHFQALIGHPHWGVRRSFVRAIAELLGAKALPLLDEALTMESDSLVRGEIAGLKGRLGHAIQ